MPDEDIQVSASGNTVTLSGHGEGPQHAWPGRSRSPRAPGRQIIDNLIAPQAVQVLLRVRFAEINRTALKDWAARFGVLNPHKLSSDGNWSGFTDPTVGATTIGFLLDSGNANIQALIQAAISEGRSADAGRAEPA